MNYATIFNDAYDAYVPEPGEAEDNVKSYRCHAAFVACWAASLNLTGTDAKWGHQNPAWVPFECLAHEVSGWMCYELPRKPREERFGYFLKILRSLNCHGKFQAKLQEVPRLYHHDYVAPEWDDSRIEQEFEKEFRRVHPSAGKGLKLWNRLWEAHKADAEKRARNIFENDLKMWQQRENSYLAKRAVAAKDFADAKDCWNKREEFIKAMETISQEVINV